MPGERSQACSRKDERSQPLNRRIESMIAARKGTTSPHPPEARPHAGALGCAGLAAALICALVAAPPSAAAPRVSSADSALHVSFEQAAFVRLRGQRFVAAGGAEVDAVNDILDRHPAVRVQRVFRAPEADIDAKRRRLVGRGQRDVPDLNRHYRLVAADTAERDRILAAVAPLAVVDEAIAEPQPAPLPATPDYRPRQRYGHGPPGGIDAAALAGLPGGRGDRVKIIDVEYSWNREHEDLTKARAAPPMPNGTPRDPYSDTNHGTAVLGTLVADDNGFGVTGLAPESQIGMVNAVESDPCDCWALPAAVALAHDNLAPGDVMLIEQQVQGRAASGGYVPPELWPAVYDAIAIASKDGVIVVEAAGNGMTAGGVDLGDRSLYGTSFPDGKPDSGAIIVGAGSGDCGTPANARMNLSAYGSRVNLQGWGQCVTTTGYGGLDDSVPMNAWYTSSFNGTSSAAAIVAGAAALYSSVHQAVKGSPPDPQFVRTRLIATGTPQADEPAGHIGPLPNLAAAAADFAAPPPASDPRPRVAPPPFAPAPGPPPGIPFAPPGIALAPSDMPRAPQRLAAPTIATGATRSGRVAAGGAVRLPRLRIRCPRTGPACIATIKVRRIGLRSAQIASARLRVGRGRSGTVRFRIRRSARALLTRRGQLKASVRVTARQAGRVRTKTLRLTLRRR